MFLFARGIKKIYDFKETLGRSPSFVPMGWANPSYRPASGDCSFWNRFIKCASYTLSVASDVPSSAVPSLCCLVSDTSSVYRLSSIGSRVHVSRHIQICAAPLM